MTTEGNPICVGDSVWFIYHAATTPRYGLIPCYECQRRAGERPDPSRAKCAWCSDTGRRNVILSYNNKVRVNQEPSTVESVVSREKVVDGKPKSRKYIVLQNVDIDARTIEIMEISVESAFKSKAAATAACRAINRINEGDTT